MFVNTLHLRILPEKQQKIFQPWVVQPSETSSLNTQDASWNVENYCTSCIHMLLAPQPSSVKCRQINLNTTSIDMPIQNHWVSGLYPWGWAKSRNMMILSGIHHCQNPLNMPISYIACNNETYMKNAFRRPPKL
jgi:hypothetical protein